MKKHLIAACAAAAVYFATSQASAAVSCNISFSDSTGLGLINQAAGALGILNLTPGNYPYYNFCGDGFAGGGSGSGDWFIADEDPRTAYQHFHIPGDGVVPWDCYAYTSQYPGGVMGKLNSSNVCVALNPLTLSRYAVFHQPDQWMRFVNASSSTRGWRPTSIWVTCYSPPLKVQFQDQNGTNWYWGNLQPCTTWNLNQSGLTNKRAVKAWVTRSDTLTGHAGSFDNFVVTQFFL